MTVSRQTAMMFQNKILLLQPPGRMENLFLSIRHFQKFALNWRIGIMWRLSSNQSLAKSKYTSVIKRTTTVKMVLKMLALTDKINYSIDERKEVRDIVYIY